jgi:hypothetical protein
MTEDEYYAGEFTDDELNCQADLANYRKAVEEFYLEYRDQMDEKPERSSGDILRSHTAEHFSMHPGRNSQFSVDRIFLQCLRVCCHGLRVSQTRVFAAGCSCLGGGDEKSNRRKTSVNS